MDVFCVARMDGQRRFLLSRVKMVFGLQGDALLCRNGAGVGEQSKRFHRG